MDEDQEEHSIIEVEMPKARKKPGRVSGFMVSEETKRKISQSSTGRVHSEETKKKISQSNAGRIVSEETKKKISKARVGFKTSDETKKKLSKLFSGEKNPFYGKRHTAETMKRVSEANTGRTLSIEHKLKIAESIRGEKNGNYGKNFSGEKSSRYGKTHTEEVRKIISEKVSGKNHRLYGKTHTEETKKRMRENSYWRGKKRPDISKSMSIRHNDPEYRKKISSSGFSNNGIYISNKAGEVRYRSSWEKEVFESLDCDVSVEKYVVEPFGLEYVYDNKIRTYYPDLLIQYTDGSQMLVEIKPKDMIQYPIVRAKFRAACAYCKENGIRFKVWHNDNCPYLLVTKGVQP
jgi:hypothetical protein